MSVKYYNYPADKDVQLSAHFKMGEFVDPSDYTSAPFPSTVPIDSDLIDILEQVREHFGCTCDINSGYRTPLADKAVSGSGSGPHTDGMAADVYYYKNGSPVPSRLVACFLQDNDVRGIGLNCGGNTNGTHIDTWQRVWHGNEAKSKNGVYETVSDFYNYTGTTKSEVYGSGDSSAPTDSTDGVETVQDWLGVDVDGIYGNKTKSALVKKLQTVLNLLYGANLAVDGIFGNRTASAIRNIKKGSQGNYVKVLQGFLICKGYNTGGLDGDFGTQTDKAVRAFQSDNGLYVDGVAGKATFAALAA
ncbi:MAG: peptidoglycan-binding protein [Alphaproteobacteria bacterium]